jgi:hypothetical protein
MATIDTRHLGKRRVRFAHDMRHSKAISLDSRRWTRITPPRAGLVAGLIVSLLIAIAAQLA